jgi:hypothetical protein
MALRQHFKLIHKGIQLGNGRCYKFKYSNYQNDAQPVIFFLYAIKGINPNTGHKWDLIQGINLHYIPASQRRAFVVDWSDVLARSKMVHFHWQWNMLMKKYPYMKLATRRYLLKPASYIQNLTEVKAEQLAGELLKGEKKDFSKIALKKYLASRK